jgi:acetylornithine deacetylase/succinyl-diaminopimelate desuccinylase-like protein
MTPFQVITYARSHRSRFLADLMDFVRFPSVSVQPKHAEDVKRCAAWLGNHLKKVGLERVKVMPTQRHPVVYAEWLHAPDLPTLLIYGHYDVQPPDPLAEWTSPPFHPTIRGNNLYGRGASDDKGQLFTHVKAIAGYLHLMGRLPINVKCLFEGEEEIGSPHLTGFIRRNYLFRARPIGTGT